MTMLASTRDERASGLPGAARDAAQQIRRQCRRGPHDLSAWPLAQQPALLHLALGTGHLAARDALIDSAGAPEDEPKTQDRRQAADLQAP